ncbi:MAG: rRNA cytosine-C5-methyltransferase [Muribaculaceae bacterium]|nr:rRNA cytosine-C5-methyltransferase [Muribaculaceae bacterium]
MLPAGFIEMLESLGLGDLPPVLEGGEPSVSVRLNRVKGEVRFDGAEPVGWCPEGLYLPSRPLFTLDPLLHGGCYYVQEAASMFHNHIARSLLPSVDRPLRVLDACGAPGGKTTAVLSALPKGSVIVANEFVPARAAVLRENLVKWGHPGVIVTRGDTASFRPLGETFDLIVADVPCSGEGMMRKDAQAVAQWSRGLVRECSLLQREIVSNLWPALRPGGWLIYSTCTFNREENEKNVEWIVSELGAESIRIPTDPSWGITEGIDTTAHCCRFIPGRTRGEGLFVALLRKPGMLPAVNPAVKERKIKGPKPMAVPSEVKRWIINPEEMAITANADRISAFPAIHTDLLTRVGEHVDVIHEGVPLATVKGCDLIPTHALALSTRLNPDAFPMAELSQDEALDYLRGEAITIPGAPRGYNIVTYKAHPLGFVKNLGNRSNNLYPQPYRIKKARHNAN